MFYKLMPHQERVTDFAVANPYSILSVAMGGGKTLIALEIFKRVGGTMVVVCPSYLINNWVREIKKFCGDKYIVTAISEGKQIYVPWDTDIVLVSYGLVQKSKFIEWADTVILDEGHYIKSMKTKVSDFMHREIYENSKKRVHILTGTPIKNRVEEFYSLMALCNYNPKLVVSKFLNKFEDSISFADYFSNRHEYTMPVGHRFVTVVKWDGYKNVEELKDYLKGIYIRVEADEFLSVEEPTYRRVQLNLMDDKMLEEAFEFFVETGSVNPTAKQKSAVLKAPVTVSYVRDLIDEAGKIVIYTDHVESCYSIAKSLGVSPITGGTPVKDREKIANDFMYGGLKYIVATIQSFSTGYTLTAAHHMVFNDISWSVGDLDQAVYRIVRIGQKNPCTIHMILGSQQDEKILSAVESKREVISMVTK